MASRRMKKWLQKVRLRKGALHRALGIPEGQKIPLSVLRVAAEQPGKLGKRARLALTMRKFKHRKK